MNYYVYIYHDKGLPIYVGKGKGQRASWHFHSNKAHLGNILRKRSREGVTLLPQIIQCKSDADSIELEIFLISEIGRKDLGKGPLLNLTDGGDGAEGYKHTEEAKSKISKSNSRRSISQETRNKISLTLKNVYQSDEMRKRAGEANRGRTLTEEHRLKMSRSTKGKPKSDETRRKMKESWDKRRAERLK
jgi:hypothetical protein